MVKDLEIRCPDCGSRLRVDARTGAIVAHGPGEKPADLGEAARRHEEQRSVKEDAFRSALAAERDRKEELDSLFKKAADKARKDDAESKPERPQDDRWR